MRRDGVAAACDTPRMLFDAPPADLPLVTVRRMAPPDRGHLILGDLDRWLSRRWAWLQPRAVPMIVAFAGLLGVLGVAKYGGAWTRDDSIALGIHTRVLDSQPDEVTPTTIVVRPLGLHDGYIVLTIDPPDFR